MIPDPWVAAVLVFAAYRWTRLIGWDDWPPVYRARAWLIGERWIPVLVPDNGDAVMGGPEPDFELPGKTPDSEVSAVRPAYSRPTLAHLVHCPFCLGWWVSLATYLVWLVVPTELLYAAAPFALSGAVGLIAKNLDA